VNRELGVSRVIDLSATPFFLRGSGYAEGTLFPWTMSDFSLMDAIECGIVKLPRVPVAENIPGNEMPMPQAVTKVSGVIWHRVRIGRAIFGFRWSLAPLRSIRPLR
jgi:type III restriction enzyme